MKHFIWENLLRCDAPSKEMAIYLLFICEDGISGRICAHQCLCANGWLALWISTLWVIFQCFLSRALYDAVIKTMFSGSLRCAWWDTFLFPNLIPRFFSSSSKSEITFHELLLVNMPQFYCGTPRVQKRASTLKNHQQTNFSITVSESAAKQTSGKTIWL